MIFTSFLCLKNLNLDTVWFESSKTKKVYKLLKIFHIN